MEQFETTMDKAVLLKGLEAKLAPLLKKMEVAQAQYKKDQFAYRKHVVSVLKSSAALIACGALGPDSHGKWCDVRESIVKDVGDAPQLPYDLIQAIERYEAAIYQITHCRGNPMRVSTNQVKEWLGGRTVHQRRR